MDELDKLLSDLYGKRPSLEKAWMNLNPVDLSALSELLKVQLHFVLSTNERGLAAIQVMESNGIDFKGAHVLDVGCAYGGFTIEAYRRGAAEVYGIDINDKFVFLAKENLKDETKTIQEGVTFATYDITSTAADELPDSFFNIIILNDVFEHIYDTTRLLSVLSRLAAPKCHLYFEIPNGLHFFDYVEREPHYHKYGLSIVEPQLSDIRGVFYRRWEFYEALFSYFGFSVIKFCNEATVKNVDFIKRYENVEKSLSEAFANDTSAVSKAIMKSLEKFKLELQHDLTSMDEDELAFKYLTSFWKGIAQYDPKRNAMRFKTHLTAETKQGIVSRITQYLSGHSK